MKCFPWLLRVPSFIVCLSSFFAVFAASALPQQAAPPAQQSATPVEPTPTKPVEASAPVSPLKEWPAKYISETKNSHSGTNVKVSISSQSLSARKGKNIVFEIPAASITEVGYDTSSHNRGWAWLKGVGGAGVHGSGEGMVVVAPLLVPAAVLAPFKSAQHFVRILWEDHEAPSEVLLEVSKQDYRAVLDDLQRLTGKPWVDLPQARKKLVAEIEQAKDRSVPIEIDRKIVLSQTEMKPGRYQTLLLERNDDQGEVYFFGGKEINAEHIAAQAVVNVEALNSETKNSGVTYVGQHGVETIGAIQLPGKKLVFISSGPPARVAKSARSFYGGGDWWATVLRTDYQGERALRFHVFYAKNKLSPFGCEGYVYVTRMRVVASEIGSNNPQTSCATFSVDRNEVRALAQKATWTNSFLKVTAGGKDYIFTPVFEGTNGRIGRVAGAGRMRDAARDYSAFFVRAVTDFDLAVEQAEAEPNPQP